MTEEERIRAQLNDEAVEEMPTSADMDPEVAAVAEEPVGKRGRGRPPKVVQIQSVQDEIEEPAAEISAEERLHPFLSNEEVLEARAEAHRQIDAERRKKAKKHLIDQEKLRLEREEGFTTGDGVKDQIVKITLDLAPHSAHIVLNLRPYYHGQTYKVPRHVAETLREIQQSGWRHQNEIEGKSLTQHYQRARTTGLSPIKGISNAPGPMADAA
jgi:hypothetical protein